MEQSNNKENNEDKIPKMVKYSEDTCYSNDYSGEGDCRVCWIKGSCEANYKSKLKKEAMAKKKKPAPREPKYKKTDKHRDW